MRTQIIQSTRARNWHVSRTAAAETRADDVRVYTDTRVIMGLLKMMHRRDQRAVFFPPEFPFPSSSRPLLPSRGNDSNACSPCR